MDLDIRPWDPVPWLKTPERQQGYLEAALADPEEGTGYLVEVVRDIARARGMVEIARLASISEEEMFESFAKDGNPSPAALEKVVAALGCKLTEHKEAT